MCPALQWAVGPTKEIMFVTVFVTVQTSIARKLAHKHLPASCN